MAVGAAISYIDDIFAFIFRKIGKGGGEEPLAYHNPQQLVSALHNPTTEAAAVARMRKMHYGAFYGKKTRTVFSGIAERELLHKGKGLSGVVFGRPAKGLSVGISHLKGMVLFAPIQGVAESVMAPRGHKISGLVGGTVKGLAWAAGDLVGTTLGGPVLGIAFGLAGERVGGMFEEGLQFMHDLNRNIKHVNMGGNYEDSQIAYTMRQRAAIELGSSVLNARHLLGKEGILMHQ